MYIYAIVYIHYTPMSICCCVLTLKWINMKMYGKLSRARKKKLIFFFVSAVSPVWMLVLLLLLLLYEIFFLFRLDVLAMQKFVIQLLDRKFPLMLFFKLSNRNTLQTTLFVTKLIDDRFSHSSDKRILLYFFFLMEQK